VTFNHAESYNNWICEARLLPVVVDHIRVQIMDHMNTRRQIAEKWVTVLCTELQKILNLNISESFTFHIVMASDDIYEVFDWCTIAVQPTLRSCTYHEWNVTHVSCRHPVSSFSSCSIA